MNSDQSSTSLEARYGFSSSAPSYLKSAKASQHYCHSRREIVEFNFSWVIDNFSFYTIDKDIESSTFSVGPNNESEWRLVIFPKGVNGSRRDYLSLYLELVSNKKGGDFKVKFKFTLLGAKGKTYECTRNVAEVDDDNDYSDDSDDGDANDDGPYKYTDGEDGYSWGYKKFIKRDFLRDKVNGLLPKDRLRIICTGGVAMDRVDICGPADGAGVEIITENVPISRDLRSLFASQQFTDITLSAGGKDLLVHKAIVAARSPVFAAMFKYDVEENKKNRLLFEDISYDILNEMLTYIYTDEAPKIETMAADLLVVADKYALEGLKVMCETTLASTLTIENAKELLVLADKYYAKQLKAQVVGFINRFVI